MNLAALEEGQLELLGRWFLRSAAVHPGNMERFLEKLDVLREAVSGGMFSFGLQELETYLQAYRLAGYPAVSHSELYRQEYRPAYRVVLKKLQAEMPEALARSMETD